MGSTSMKAKDLGMTALCFIAALFVVLGVGSALFTKKDDGPIEELSEEAIEYATKEIMQSPNGFDVDLTPNSPEK